MYLVAVKSFCQWDRPKHITVLIDGQFDTKALSTLRAHVPGVTIEPYSEYRNSKCPAGGTWERLLALIIHSVDEFTIQLDADTITLGPLDVVSRCVAGAHAFTLGSLQGQHMEAAGAASVRACKAIADGDTHIQTVSESKLDGLMASQNIRYVRGCSGFTGVPRHTISLDTLITWSSAMQQLVGPRWAEWGTEQFMSNLLIANAPDSVVLPHPDYATCPNISETATKFAHMAGFCRFANNHQYARLARRAIDTLRQRTQAIAG